ncbi:MAG: site-2 protease family protein [Cyanobacteria bacterium Co-bin13]|nr:site-2 protease family protein [Cyanobacteria bacterium Co-bin13]
MLLIWLLLLSVFTYFVVKRSVANITRTPTWLLWLVMMLPAFTLAGWMVVRGRDEPAPAGLLLILFVVCPLLYWFLIQWGRIPLPKTAAPQEDAAATSSPALPNAPKAALRPIDKEEETALQHCFPWTVYYLQNIEYRPQAMICRGQLRTSPTVAYETVSENIQEQFGNRFLVVFQEGGQGKPFFALVPNPQAQSEPAASNKTLARPGIALALLLTTLFTTTWVGTYIAGVTDDQLRDTPQLLSQGLAYAISLLFILGCHEMGHYLVARRHRIKVTLPYFIPVPFFLGTFGAFIQMRSPVPNRRALFDVGIAGPLSGLIVTLPLLLWGLAHSELVPLAEEASLLNFEAMDPRASVLLALLSKLALGGALTAENAVHLHPVAVSGCLGLVVTALNLMPVGQLDGGHLVHAMYGQRMGAIIGQITRILVLFLVAVHPELLLWAILLFFIPAVDEPALNDVSELDNRRDVLGLATLALLVMIVLPLPPLLNQLLF